MALEIYSILKNKQTLNKYEYTVNIISAFAMGLFDLLITVQIFKLYSSLNNYSLFTFDNSITTHVLALFITDFVFYCSHYCGHKFPLFWAIHGVHHQPQNYNLSVGLRQPWFHKLYSTSFYLVIAFIGVPLEVLQNVYAIIVVSQFWTHTEFLRKEIPFLSKIIMTPSQHRVHHGQNEKYIDKNFGLAFSLWDHLFKTHTPETEKVIFGTNEQFEKSNPLWANIYPFILLFKKIKAAYLKNKLFRYLIGLEQIKVDVADPYASLPQDKTYNLIFSFNYYLFQNIILTVITLYVLLTPLTLIQKIVAMIILMLSYGVVGLLGDRKVLARVLLIPMILALIMLTHWFNPWLAAMLILVNCLSLLIIFINKQQSEKLRAY
jgi:sterol desaturase/sphingolipid hydroxylase (fatty acid hydroxylase superfamily)